MQIAIISDTHMPRGGRRLPPDCLERLEAADLIIHAGDLCAMSVLGELEAIGPVVAVRGNVDDPEVRAALPETAVLALGDGLHLALVHDAGPSRGRLDRLRARFPEATAVVFGHSHIPLHQRAADGFQIFNPGSPTERRRSPEHTMGLASVSGDGIDFDLIALGTAALR
jgi:putative phosphoesterase